MEERFLVKAAELCKMLPVMPMIGGPQAKQQPVFCLDVAAAVQQVLMREVRAVRGGERALPTPSPHRAPTRAAS
jgi:hypothetical protein